MKKFIVFVMALCLLLVGCGNSQEPTVQETAPAETLVSDVTPEVEPPVIEAIPATEEAASALAVMPLPDATMDNLTDAILPISLDVGDVYVDESGVTQMALTVYTYDKYDMVDIANLKEGDSLVTYAGEVKVTSREENEAGTILINGGLDEGGFDLATDDCGIYYEQGYSDTKSWYPLGDVTIPVSENFKGYDGADLDHPDAVLSADVLLDDQIIIFDFTPYNTTVRVEGGEIVELTRIYTP